MIKYKTQAIPLTLWINVHVCVFEKSLFNEILLGNKINQRWYFEQMFPLQNGKGVPRKETLLQ